MVNIKTARACSQETAAQRAFEFSMQARRKQLQIGGGGGGAHIFFFKMTDKIYFFLFFFFFLGGGGGIFVQIIGGGDFSKIYHIIPLGPEMARHEES